MLALHALAYARGRPTDLAILICLFAVLTLSIGYALIDRFSAAHSFRCTVVQNRPVAEGVCELHLTSAAGGKAPQFAAGSIVYLRFDGPGFSRQWHPFSVASCRYESDLRLIIKGLGADTAKIADLRNADSVLIRGPFREFTPDFSREQIWIAGGIGIAPFAGYAACLGHLPAARVTVFHWYEHKAQQLDLQAYASRIEGNLAQIHALTSPHTPPDLTRLIDYARGKNEAQFIVCGPPVFMRFVRRSLKRAGIDGRNIETEEFLPW